MGSWPVLDVVEVTGSTNADLLARARTGERGPAALAARSQQRGRGRLDRAWSSPPGASVALSLLWCPTRAQPGWSWLPMLLGLAVTDAVARLGVAARLKWPNDVVVGVGEVGVGEAGVGEDGGVIAPAGTGALTGLHKLAGILVEVAGGPRVPAVVAGIGLNLAQERAELPVPGATSLRLLLGDDAPGFDEVVALLLAATADRLVRWEGGADDELRAEYRAACTTLGRQVTVTAHAGSTPLQGRAVDIDADGSMVVDDGVRKHRVAAGDVEHVR